MRHYARDDSHRYRTAPVMRWHWRTNEAYDSRPAAYAVHERYDQYYQQGLKIDERAFTGGVGYGADGFVDGYGQMHFANGIQNGPTYNSYGQSFQFNPSHAAPFQPHMMGSGGFGPRGR